MKHFLFYLITLTVCLPFASCSDEFAELPYAYDEISYRRGYDLDIPLDTVVYIESQAEFDQLFADEETKPEASVPFSEGVLAVVKGIANGGIVDLQKNLIQSDYGALVCRLRHSKRICRQSRFGYRILPHHRLHGFK